MATNEEALDRANEVMAAYGSSIRSFFQAEKRDELTSVLFDVPRRSLLGWHCLYRHAPEFFNELWRETTPEDFGRRMAQLGTRPYQLQLAILALGFLAARQHLLMTRACRLDGVARHTPEGLGFVDRSQAVGWRQAVRERDDPFGDYGSRSR